MRSTFPAKGPFYLLILSVFFAPAILRAEPYFREAQVLPHNHAVDVIAWRVDGDPADSAWDCAKADSADIRSAKCEVRPYGRSETQPYNYLYWAFLNLGPATQRAYLSPRDADDDLAFRPYQRPLLALKERNDTCLYLVLHRDQLAPLAGGRVACGDLSQGLKAVAADLAGRDHLIPRADGEGEPERINKELSFANQAPKSLDYGLEVAIAAAGQFSGDQDPDPNNPYSSGTQVFDFEDYAVMGTPPMSVRASLLFRDVVGVRAGFTYSSWNMTEGMRSALNEQISQRGGYLSEWTIDRKDWTVEFLAGLPAVGNKVEAPMYGLLGFGKTTFSETAVINGQKYPDQRLLADVSVFELGGGIQLRVPYFFIGFEVNAFIKDFEFRNATSQPDGSGSEFQFRVYMGSYYRQKVGGI